MGKHSKTNDGEKEIKEPKQQTKKQHKRLKIFFITLAIIIAILGGLFAKKVYDLDGNWLAVLFGHNKNTLKNLDRINILVMGESTGCTDTILIFTYDPKIQEAGMLSIPRDTFTGSNTKKAKASDKINSLYLNGTAPEETLEAVNEITGLNVEYYIVLDTKALSKLVDLIGGIEFEVPIDMKYDDYSQDLHINLEQGYQKLDGNQVEQLVRFRHNNDGSTYSYEYGMEDYGRMKTQRNVIKTIASQTIKLKNVTEIGNMVDILNEYVNTNIDIKFIKDYIPYAVNMNVDEVKTEQLPGESEILNGIWFFLHDEEETKIIVENMFTSNTTETNAAENTNQNNTVNE